MAKKILTAGLVLLVIAWCLFAFTGHWHHQVVMLSGDDWAWHSNSHLGALVVVGLVLAVALLTVGGTLLGVLVLLALIGGSLFLGLAFVSVPVWLPILVLWLLVRPGRPSAG
ncbi:hypothetical protein PVT67_03165 [Gallaecimonas kandeliae]|uniref:hypothetical protein n=1 Tax=Gallaecimonas kandeliae TaxID=3029055 RepID=UPI00264742F3|nr:hypothetical protein [Gallaecimonas kandeliae]WKE66264.1 hypothetical protein PVT67_03165 [Gallaecimonas kandeliae]